MRHGEPTKPTSFRVKKSLYEEWVKYAREHGHSMAWMLEVAIKKTFPIGGGRKEESSKKDD